MLNLVSKSYLLILLYFLFSCNETKPDTCDLPKQTQSYAENFSIEYQENYTLLNVYNPWKDASIDFQYLLYPKTLPIPKEYPKAIKIAVPVDKIVCTSTTHVAMLDYLDAIDKIVGISGTDFIYNKDIQQRINEGKIKEVGVEGILNFELLLDLQADIILSFGVGANNDLNKITSLGLKPVVIAEWMDKHPLGRTEWVRFVAELIGKRDFAERKFAETDNKYKLLASQVSSIKQKPTVFTGMGFKGKWNIPTKDNYVSQWIRDAGGKYIWEDLKGSRSEAFDFEVVYSKTKDADMWINVGMVSNLTELKGIDERYSYFGAWKNKQVYNPSKRISAKGGYDIYESAVVYPELVLKDLINIFHPKLNKSDSLFYYEHLR